MFGFILVEAIVIFIGVVTIAKSFFNNQRRQLLAIISLGVGLFVPYTLVVNDLFNSFAIVTSIAEFVVVADDILIAFVTGPLLYHFEW